MTKKTAGVKWWWWVTCNTRKNWRERFGMALRNLADRLDGRQTLAIRMRSNPALPEKTREAIMAKGIVRMQQLLNETARLESIEVAYRETHPKFFDTPAKPGGVS